MKGFKTILTGASALICMTAATAMAAGTKTPVTKTTVTTTHTAAPAATAAATTTTTTPAVPATTTAAAPAATTAATAPAAPAESKGGFFSSLTGHKTETAPASATPAPAANKPPPPAPAFTGLEYVAQAPVGLEDARRAALKAHPGSVTNSVLGLDKAGKLRYVFTISGSEVFVDAADGKIMAKD